MQGWVPQGGVPNSDRWWLVLRQPPSCTHLSLSLSQPSPLRSLVVLLSHNYNSIVIQFWGRQINRISFLVTRPTPPTRQVEVRWGEVRHGGCGRVGCTCSSSDWCLCQLFWCQINKLLTVGRQAGGGRGRGRGGNWLATCCCARKCKLVYQRGRGHPCKASSYTNRHASPFSNFVLAKTAN